MSMRRLTVMACSLRSAPSTLSSRSMSVRSLPASSSLSAFTRVSALTPAFSSRRFAVVGPMPKMYVSATSMRFSVGRSMPAMRATESLLSALTLLVPRIAAADHTNHALATHHLAVLADLLHGRSNLHDRFSLFTAARLLVAIRDPAARQVVRGHLDRHLVARQDLDEMHPHLARDVSEQTVAVLELHAKRRVRERLDHGPLDLDALFFRQSQPFYRSSGSTERISGPSGPTATVCSKWADQLPSLVTTVQPSARVVTAKPPAFTIGSIASTCPATSFEPLPAGPWFGTDGSSCIARPMPCPTRSRTTEKPCRSTCDCTACEISPTRFPARAWRMPFSRASSVTRMRRLAFSDTAPTAKVRAASAYQPCNSAPTSIPTRSPSASARGPGMPWTTSSFTEEQIEAGNPRKPLNAGRAPCSRSSCSAARSSSAVVTPGRTARPSSRSTRATM